MWDGTGRHALGAERSTLKPPARGTAWAAEGIVSDALALGAERSMLETRRPHVGRCGLYGDRVGRAWHGALERLTDRLGCIEGCATCAGRVCDRFWL